MICLRFTDQLSFFAALLFLSVSGNAADIANPGFESGLSQWAEVDPAASAIALSDATRSGSRSVKITGEEGYLQQKVEVEPHTAYVVSADIRGVGPIGVKAGGTLFYERQKDAKAWQRTAVTFNSGESSNAFIFAGFGGAQDRFDDFTIEAADKSPSTSVSVMTTQAVDGTISATLAVNHVTTTGRADEIGQVVIGQIHARNDEPIKLYYRKMPGHERGSVYVAHEPAGQDDIHYALLGDPADTSTDPVDGIRLDEKFSYEIIARDHELLTNILQNDKVIASVAIDQSTSGFDGAVNFMYFKAGAYNQNSTGNPAVYGQVTFYELEASHSSAWMRIDDFQSENALQWWHLRDTDNQTDPRIENPQVTEVVYDDASDNHYLSKKPAADGVAGNRKALSFLKPPAPVPVGETYTFYARINVEYFPNNHVFGLSNLGPRDIEKHNYDALEPGLRATDKHDSDGTENDGTLMVRRGTGYAKVINPRLGRPANPLKPGVWYETWTVVNNARAAQGGQRYDVYIRGGEEFPDQQKVFTNADFRMARELPLIYFLANCNTGPAKAPYGNGALRFDDLYMARGTVLTAPPAGHRTAQYIKSVY